jgi:hypothetical protein
MHGQGEVGVEVALADLALEIGGVPFAVHFKLARLEN